MVIFSNFFSNQADIFFRPYGTSHLSALALILISALTTIYTLRKVTESKKKKFRIILAFITILQHVLYILWVGVNGDLNPENTLPLNMCTASLFLVFLALLTRNKAVINMVYFWGVVGSIYALFFPTLLHDFPHFRYFEFFTAHGCIVIAIIYFIFIEKCKVTFKETLHSYLITVVYVIVVYIVNLLLYTNFLFLMNKPSIGLLVDIPEFVFKLWLVFGTFTLFIILYFPFWIAVRISSIKRRV